MCVCRQSSGLFVFSFSSLLASASINASQYGYCTHCTTNCIVCVCEHTVVAESRHPWGVFEQRRSTEALFIMYAVSLNDRAPLLSWCPGHWLTPADSWLFMSWYHVAVFVHFYFAPFTYFSSWVLPCKVSALLGWLSPHCLVYLVMAWQRTCYFAHKLSTDQR